MDNIPKTAQNVNKKVGATSKRFISTTEFMSLTGISTTTLRRYLRDGTIKTVQFRKNGTHHIPLEYVDRLLEAALGGE